MPSWSTLLDASVVLVLLLAVSVAIFGGFREYFGSIRISVRSADRLVILAVLLTVVRHALRPHPST